MIHYHGGPITPERVALEVWSGRHAFVSWLRPDQLYLAAEVTQSFALDNGAFSAWRSGKTVDWNDYYAWTEAWLPHPKCDWAIIPDVIDGTETENDALVAEWPHGERGVPVWHMNESIDRLKRLAVSWPRVAIGSTAEFDASKPATCVRRFHEVLPSITNSDGYPITKLHGLRMLNPKITTAVPLSSGDSTNLARNVGLDAKFPHGPRTRVARAAVLLDRIEGVHTPSRLQDIEPATPQQSIDLQLQF